MDEVDERPVGEGTRWKQKRILIVAGRQPLARRRGVACSYSWTANELPDCFNDVGLLFSGDAGKHR